MPPRVGGTCVERRAADFAMHPGGVCCEVRSTLRVPLPGDAQARGWSWGVSGCPCTPLAVLDFAVHPSMQRILVAASTEQRPGLFLLTLDGEALSFTDLHPPVPDATPSAPSVQVPAVRAQLWTRNGFPACALFSCGV